MLGATLALILLGVCCAVAGVVHVVKRMRGRRQEDVDV